MEMTTITCPICDKQFEIAAYRLKYGRGKCCSEECSYKARAVAQRKRVEKVCERCGKTFTITPSMDAKGKGRFCSAVCKWPAEIVTCAECGKQFRTSPSTHKRYCSKECAYASQERSDDCRARALRQWQDDELRPKTLAGIKRRSQSEGWREHMYFKPGKESPFYTNGNGQNAPRPTNYETKEWRREVFRRDNYTCQECGEHGGRLNAHHIKPWKDHPDLRFDIANGITLCVPCHLKTHGLSLRAPNYRCVDCGKLKTSGKSPRCHSCGTKNAYAKTRASPAGSP